MAFKVSIFRLPLHYVRVLQQYHSSVLRLLFKSLGWKAF